MCGLDFLRRDESENDCFGAGDAGARIAAHKGETDSFWIGRARISYSKNLKHPIAVSQARLRV